MVPDARADPRFADNPLVTGKEHLRFYAGAPLMSPEGYMLGTLAVLDREPRSFSESDKINLTLLAAQVLDGILLLRAGLRARESKERFAAFNAQSSRRRLHEGRGGPLRHSRTKRRAESARDRLKTFTARRMRSCRRRALPPALSSRTSGCLKAGAS